MFLLECSSNSNRLSSNNRLSLENTSCLKNVPDSDDCVENKTETVRLFSEVYHRDSLEYHQEELFSKCKNYFRLLSNSAKLMKLPQAPASQFHLHSNYIELRKSLVMFFNCIRENLEDNISYIKNSYTIKTSVVNFKDQLFTFRLLLGKMDKLPDFVLQNYHTESGNQSSLASFHLFHLYLELYWLLFSIMLQYKSAADLNNENLLESEEMCTQDIFSDLNEKFDTEITQEIEWFLYNLISVSSRCYDMKGSKGIFSCNCIKDVWCSLINSINKLGNENKCASFWEYYNNIVFKYVLNFEEVPHNKCNINNLFTMNNIKSNKRLEFSLGLLSKIVKVLDENTKNMDSSENVNPNFVILEAILNKISKADETIPETSMRDMMKQIINISNVWTEPKSEIVMSLWEYFHKRMNSAFSISGQNSLDVQKKFFNSSIEEIIIDLNFHLSVADLSKNSIKYENSFSLFLSLLGMHMKSSVSMQQPAYCQKVKGRILPKFNLNKVVSLNEFGLKHFSFLFLILAKATDTNMCDKLQDLISKLPFDNLPLNKKQIIIKTHLIILHMYIEDGKSITKAASPLKVILNKLSNLRDSDSMNLVKIALNDYLEILNTSSGFQNDEHVLIDSWISKYLTVCNISDLYNVLDMFCTVLNKIRLLCSYDMNINESVSTLISTFFNHIYTTVKLLFANGLPALQVANLAYEFVKLILENDMSKQYGDFQSTLKYFINIEGANNRVVRHFLCKLLQDDDILKSLEGQNKECQILLVNCWVKCSLLFGEEVSDDDTHLMLLINQLEEFSKLNITPGYGDGEQKNLCKFLYALGQTWATLQSDIERKNFKEKVNQYLNNIDKEIIPMIKSPSSVQRTTHLFVALGSLFIHCSRIIYTRGDPLCLFHRLINTVLLPPHVFMGKKHHPHVSTGICRSWYMFMRGMHNLDHKSDMYVEKVMKDLILQYLPHFVEKVFSRDIPFNVTYKMFPRVSEDLLLERYILEKISAMFITCTGKQTHANSAMALCIILDMSNTNDINLVLIIISCTFLSIFEQIMFSDASQPNRKISEQILKTICNLPSHDIDIRQEVVEALVKACQKHLAFNSVAFFKLVSSLLPLLGSQLMTSFLGKLKTEVAKIEKMRSVGFDQGLRKGIRDIESRIQEYR